MILGFAKFSERSRKLIKNIKKTASKRQRKKHEKSIKNTFKINPKTIKNPFKNRCVFQARPKIIIWRLWAASGRLKVAVFNFLVRFWHPLGFKGSPKSSKIAQVAAKWSKRANPGAPWEGSWSQPLPGLHFGSHFWCFLDDFWWFVDATLVNFPSFLWVNC